MPPLPIFLFFFLIYLACTGMSCLDGYEIVGLQYPHGGEIILQSIISSVFVISVLLCALF